MGLVLGLLLPQSAWAQRLALVIGNGAYEATTPLNNPVNDAQALSAKLAGLGFEVTTLTDLEQPGLWPALDRFALRAATAEIALFYFSGHAFQLDGANYLLPVDARLTSLDSLPDAAWPLDRLLARFGALGTDMVVMLDACRNDPLPPSMGAGRISGGLARVETGADLLTVYATQPNMVAYESGEDLSFFTQALVDHIGTEGASLTDVVRNVRNQVRTETNRRQVPWSGGNLSRAFYFRPKAESRSTLSDVDLENLLLNFPAEQRPELLATLARTMGLDQERLSTRIDTIAPSTQLSVLIGGDEVAPAPAPEPQAEASPVPRPQLRPETAEPTAPELERLAIALPPVPSSPAERQAATGPQAAPRPVPKVQAQLRPVRTKGPELTARRLSPNRDLRAAPQARPSLLPVAGVEFWLEDQEAWARLALESPDLAQKAALPEGRDLDAQVQRELARLGCYRNEIDGIFGKNSRFALTSYYLAKGLLFEDLDPTPSLLRQLQVEPSVVCTGSQVRAPKTVKRVVAAAPAPKAAPAKPRNPTKQVSKKVEEQLTSGKRSIGMRMMR